MGNLTSDSQGPGMSACKKKYRCKYTVLCISLCNFYLLLYVAFNSQGHIATGSLQVEETSAYFTVNHRASASNYQLSNMKCPARDSNQRPQRLEARTLTTAPPSPLYFPLNHSPKNMYSIPNGFFKSSNCCVCSQTTSYSCFK